MRLVILLMLAFPAYAETSLQLGHNTYTHERLEPTHETIQARWGGALYAWGSYEKPSVTLVGQGMGTTKLWGYGLGFGTDHGIQIEFGRFHSNENLNHHVVHESVVATLNNHHSITRGSPAHFQDSDYNIRPGFGGRIRAVHNVTDSLGVSIAYRYLVLQEDLDAWSGGDHCPNSDNVPKGCSYWQERGTTNLSSLEFGISYIFY